MQQKKVFQLQHQFTITDTHARSHACMHTYRFSSGRKEVEDCTSQLFEPLNFPQPRNTTLLHEFFLATTQILEHMPTQCLPTRLPHGVVP